MLTAIDTSKLTPEEREMIMAMTSREVSIAIPMSAAIVTHGVLTSRLDELIAEMVRAMADGDDSKASALCALGQSVMVMADAIKKMAMETPEMAKVIAIAQRETDKNGDLLSETSMAKDDDDNDVLAMIRNAANRGRDTLQ